MKIENTEIIYKNKPFEKIFKKDFSIFIELSRTPGQIKGIQEKLRKGGVIHEMELKLKDKFDKTVWMIATFHRIWFKGNDTIIVGLNDITETKNLQQKFLELVEQGQRRKGLDLHDDTCQKLAGISVMTRVVSNGIKKLDEKLGCQINEIGELINSCIADIANIARGLYPADLERNGLNFALLEITKRVKHQFKIPCDVFINEDINITDKERQLHFFRISQELIYNAFKHSKGTKIKVTLSRQGKYITITVEDNGKGFDLNRKKSDRMGLVSIMYRAQLIDGELNFTHPPGGGTIARCIIKEENYE